MKVGNFLEKEHLFRKCLATCRQGYGQHATVWVHVRGLTSDVVVVSIMQLILCGKMTGLLQKLTFLEFGCSRLICPAPARYFSRNNPIMSAEIEKDLKRAAQVVKESKAIVITAGAGIGVDSGLPDFRGPEGFWKAYPPLKKLGLTLPETSTPRWFDSDPHFAWGFFGHRLNLYRNTQPHRGFSILRRWGESKESGYFIFTSNVDGQFQKAGFSEDKVVECHGSINFLQKVDGRGDIWPTPSHFHVIVDEATLKADGPLPRGPPGSHSCLSE